MGERTFRGDAVAFGALAADLADMKDLDADLARRAEAVGNRVAIATLGSDRKHTGKGRGWNVPLDVKARRLRERGGVVLTPTRTSAGPWTETDKGRNTGNAPGYSGPAINTRTGVTARNKRTGNLIRRRTKRRQWNGTTDGRGTAGQVVAGLQRDLLPVIEKSVIAKTKKRLEG